jgi:hypothetical protein
MGWLKYFKAEKMLNYLVYRFSITSKENNYKVKVGENQSYATA